MQQVDQNVLKGITCRAEQQVMGVPAYILCSYTGITHACFACTGIHVHCADACKSYDSLLPTYCAGGMQMCSDQRSQQMKLDTDVMPSTSADAVP